MISPLRQRHRAYDRLLRAHGYRRRHDLETQVGYALHYERPDGQHVEIMIPAEWTEPASRHPWVHSSKPWAQDTTGQGVRSLAGHLRGCHAQAVGTPHRVMTSRAVGRLMAQAVSAS